MVNFQCALYGMVFFPPNSALYVSLGNSKSRAVHGPSLYSQEKLSSMLLQGPFEKLLNSSKATCGSQDLEA